VRLGALVFVCWHLPEEAHQLALAAKCRRELLDCDAVEAEKVSIALVVSAKGGSTASLLRGRMERVDHLLGELHDLIVAHGKEPALKRCIAFDSARLAQLDDARLDICGGHLQHREKRVSWGQPATC
jgi:hypothetical protein